MPFENDFTIFGTPVDAHQNRLLRSPSTGQVPTGTHGRFITNAAGRVFSSPAAFANAQRRPGHALHGITPEQVRAAWTAFFQGLPAPPEHAGPRVLPPGPPPTKPPEFPPTKPPEPQGLPVPEPVPPGVPPVKPPEQGPPFYIPDVPPEIFQLPPVQTQGPPRIPPEGWPQIPPDIFQIPGLPPRGGGPFSPPNPGLGGVQGGGVLGGGLGGVQGGGGLEGLLQLLLGRR